MAEETGCRWIQDIQSEESELAKLVPLCGSLVSAVLFSCFEEMFRRAGQGAKEISGTSQDWLNRRVLAGAARRICAA